MSHDLYLRINSDNTCLPIANKRNFIDPIMGKFNRKSTWNTNTNVKTRITVVTVKDSTTIWLPSLIFQTNINLFICSWETLWDHLKISACWSPRCPQAEMKKDCFGKGIISKLYNMSAEGSSESSLKKRDAWREDLQEDLPSWSTNTNYQYSSQRTQLTNEEMCNTRKA